MTESSDQTLNEAISALMDGESHDVDLQRVLSSCDSEATRQTWVRYQTIRSVMKGEATAIRVDLSSSIMEAIADDEPATAKSDKRFMGLQGIWSGVGKTAIAASVTFGVIFGAQQFVGSDVQAPAETVATAPEAVNDPGGAIVPQGFELPPLSASTVSTNSFVERPLPQSALGPLPQGKTVLITSDEFQEQINRLLFKHAEQVSSSGALGVMPYARVSELNEEAPKEQEN